MNQAVNQKDQTENEHRLEMLEHDLRHHENQLTDIHANLSKTLNGIEKMEEEARAYKSDLKARMRLIEQTKEKIKFYKS